MGKERFEFARIASPEEIAEYLGSLAVGLKRGEISLESGERALRLVARGGSQAGYQGHATRSDKGKIRLELGWKRPNGGRGPPSFAWPSARARAR